jgi:hypothetical protein
LGQVRKRDWLEIIGSEVIGSEEEGLVRGHRVRRGRIG